jgi:integrase
VKGSLRARKPGVWELRVFLGTDPVTGKKQYRSSTFHGRRSDAQTALARLVTEAAAPLGARRIATRDVTLTDLVEIHLERHPGSVTTLAGYRSILDVHIRPTIGRFRIRDVHAMVLDRFYDHLATERGLSPARIHQAHAVLRGAFRLAVRWGWLPRNPAVDANPPTVRRKDVGVPAVEDVAAALAEAERRDPVLGTFVRLAAATGARRGELCGLTWRHVDLPARRLRIEQTVVTTTRSGLVVKDTKNHSKRVITLDAETIAALERHRRRMAEIVLLCGQPWNDAAFLFPSEPDGSSPWNPDSVTRRWATVRAAVGLPKLRLHDLRHFQATMLLKAGVPVKNVSARIGHRDASTTLNIYAHMLEDVDDASAELIGQLLPEASESRRTSSGGPKRVT